MNIGTAQTDITPAPGIDLAGFAMRVQPSTSLLDPLWARAMYLEDGPEQFVWLHLDLLALDQRLADALREEIAEEMRLPSTRVLVSTTHTHSGPATIRLTGCGAVEPAYLSRLDQQCLDTVRAARRHLEPCQIVSAQGACSLAQDRRNLPSAHTDPRVGALGWRRADGTLKAVFLNYSMHPVCLRGAQISADWPGEAARCLSAELPGQPVAFVTAGACGNLNPPAGNVAPAQMQAWGRAVAEVVLAPLGAAKQKTRVPKAAGLRTAAMTMELPIEPLTPRAVEEYVQSSLADDSGHREFDAKFRLAIQTWRAAMLDRLQSGAPPLTLVHLGAVALGPAAFLTVNAEIFSRFTELAGAGADRPVYTVSCANGMIGYVPTAAAYDEGGYEVSRAMLFYNLPRPQKGGLEKLARGARQLLASCHCLSSQAA